MKLTSELLYKKIEQFYHNDYANNSSSYQNLLVIKSAESYYIYLTQKLTETLKHTTILVEKTHSGYQSQVKITYSDKSQKLMIVVARNNGPLCDNYDGHKERTGLLEGKEYNVISWAYNNGRRFTETDIDSGLKGVGYFANIKEPRFFIKVINEYGIEHDYWNDYFLSSEEFRDMKLNQILNTAIDNKF